MPRLRTRGITTLFHAVLGLGLFVSLVTLPNFIAADNADEGYCQLLAYLATTNARFGVDVIFPYGPLFDLVLNAYEPRLFWRKYGFELLGKSIATLLMLRAAGRIRAGAVWLSSIAILNLALPMPTEIYLVAMAAWIVTRGDSLGELIALSAALAALSLAKFTACPFAIVLLIFISASIRKNALRAVVPLSSYFVVLVLLFLFCGQRLGDLPAYLRTGFEYSNAYTDGLALEGPRFELRLGLSIVLVFIAANVRHLFDSRIATLLLLTAIYWKYGFVRHDAHALGFFAMMLMITPMAMIPASSRLRSWLAILVIILSMLGIVSVLNREKLWDAAFGTSPTTRWIENASRITHPMRLKTQLDSQRREQMVRHALPQIQSIVGESSMDVFTDCQGVALLNGFHLVPRPTLQSVNAVNAAWLTMNAERLRSESSPRFLLVHWHSFDLRYPTLTDGPALLAMLEGFEIRCEEREYLLLERRKRPATISVDTAETRNPTIDEVTELPSLPDSAMRIISVDVRLTAAGELRKAALRPPTLFFLVRDDTGEWHPYRIIAPMARVPFLLDPLCETSQEMKSLFASRSGRKVTAIKLHVMPGERSLVKPVFSLQFQNLIIRD